MEKNAENIAFHQIFALFCIGGIPTRNIGRAKHKTTENCSGLFPSFFILFGMRRGFCLLIVVLLIASTLCGCVRRRMTVISNPPGATVYLDGKEIGRTPFSTNFDHYGKREFRVVKQGYETKTELKPVRSPWYQWVGLDFVSEVVLPGKLTDHKYYEFDLQPDRIAPGPEIVARAEEFRQTAHADGVPRVGGSAIAAPSAQVGSIDAGTPTIPVPNFAPIVPSEIILTPPSPPPNPNTFVPPVL
jgi:hypothetical protein